eukprot:g1567.t1
MSNDHETFTSASLSETLGDTAKNVSEKLKFRPKVDPSRRVTRHHRGEVPSWARHIPSQSTLDSAAKHHQTKDLHVKININEQTKDIFAHPKKKPATKSIPNTTHRGETQPLPPQHKSSNSNVPTDAIIDSADEYEESSDDDDDDDDKNTATNTIHSNENEKKREDSHRQNLRDIAVMRSKNDFHSEEDQKFASATPNRHTVSATPYRQQESANIIRDNSKYTQAINKSAQSAVLEQVSSSANHRENSDSSGSDDSEGSSEDDSSPDDSSSSDYDSDDDVEEKIVRPVFVGKAKRSVLAKARKKQEESQKETKEYAKKRELTKMQSTRKAVMNVIESQHRIDKAKQAKLDANGMPDVKDLPDDTDYFEQNDDILEKEYQLWVEREIKRLRERARLDWLAEEKLEKGEEEEGEAGVVVREGDQEVSEKGNDRKIKDRKNRLTYSDRFFKGEGSGNGQGLAAQQRREARRKQK